MRVNRCISNSATKLIIMDHQGMSALLILVTLWNSKINQMDLICVFCYPDGRILRLDVLMNDSSTVQVLQSFEELLTQHYSWLYGQHVTAEYGKIHNWWTKRFHTNIFACVRLIGYVKSWNSGHFISIKMFKQPCLILEGPLQLISILNLKYALIGQK